MGAGGKKKSEILGGPPEGGPAEGSGVRWSGAGWSRESNQQQPQQPQPTPPEVEWRPNPEQEGGPKSGVPKGGPQRVWQPPSGV